MTTSPIADADPLAPRRTLARARLARFLAELLADVPPTSLDKLAAPEVRAEIDDAFAALGFETALADSLFDQLRRPDALVAARARHLGHTVRSACPAYELEYSRAEVFQQAASLADLAGFYAAFGYAPAGPLAERPDHLVAECEFLADLALRQLLAAHRAAPQAVEICLAAQRRYLADHAARWMPAFFERLRRAEPDGPLAPVAALGQALLADWCSAFGLHPGPQWLELRPVEADDVSISCGVPSALDDSRTDALIPFQLGQSLAAALHEERP
ncbi:MAG: hypothetical protein CHACPFDD_03043 [Phycisphaerae bacterium]|nr:hypothetical protein [Phycisphaerae bacterium]